MKQHPGTFAFGVVFVVLGIAYLLDVYGAWDIRPVRLWPILLIAVGAVLAIGGRAGRRNDD